MESPQNYGWVLGGLITVGLASVGSLLLWWGNSRHFLGRFEQWREEVKDRFDRSEKRTHDIEAIRARLEDARDQIEELFKRTEHIAAMSVRLDDARAEIVLLRTLRHDVAGVQKSISMLVDLLKHNGKL